jgi:uncharacterized protein (TIGR00725 family)
VIPAKARVHRLVVAVVGPSTCGDDEAALAQAVGREIAERGAALLCAGGAGIAEKAAAGAQAAGGLTLALLPGAGAAESPPNPSIELALFTGLGDASAAAIATAADGLVAIGGGFGTLAQIGLFLRAKKPVVLLGSWRFAIDDITPNVPRAPGAAEAVTLLWDAINRS